MDIPGSEAADSAANEAATIADVPPRPVSLFHWQVHLAVSTDRSRII